jgi:hypothetical protein
VNHYMLAPEGFNVAAALWLWKGGGDGDREQPDDASMWPQRCGCGKAFDPNGARIAHKS